MRVVSRSEKTPATNKDVVIPWRGFRCFTPPRGGREGLRSAGGVVIPWRGFRCFTRTRNRHRGRRGLPYHVVIPWRGFRCFTPWTGAFGEGDAVDVVVIPWRGFRCFTPPANAHNDPGEVRLVVIPWRGFRCFTLINTLLREKVGLRQSCNPLAGI